MKVKNLEELKKVLLEDIEESEHYKNNCYDEFEAREHEQAIEIYQYILNLLEVTKKW